MHRFVSLVVAAALAAPVPALACGMYIPATERAVVAEAEPAQGDEATAEATEEQGATLAALMGEIDGEPDPAQANREKVAEEAGEPTS